MKDASVGDEHVEAAEVLEGAGNDFAPVALGGDVVGGRERPERPAKPDSGAASRSVTMSRVPAAARRRAVAARCHPRRR